jgi:LacI family transcriptional regulator
MARLPQPQSSRATKTVANDIPSVRPTLRAIAREAGVSLGTVSLALRDNPQTSRATRARIKAVATKMGYRPDPRVAKLMSYLQQKKHRNRDGTIAYLTAFAQRDAWRDSVTWTNYFEGAEAKADELGYRLEHFWMREPGMSEARLSRILHSRGIDGVLIAPVPKSHRKMQLEWDWFSTVAFGYSLQHPRVHRVVHSHFHTTSIVTGELRARGYERIGLVIGTDHDERVTNLWSAGFLAFKGVTDPKHAVPLFRGAIEPGPLLKWFRRNRPDAVVSDELHAVQILDAAGCCVPRDFAFVTLDWLERTRPFAGVDQHSRDVGAAAAKQVISALQRDERGLPPRPETLMIEGSWVDGESVPLKKNLAAVAPLLKANWLDRSNWQ